MQMRRRCRYYMSQGEQQRLYRTCGFIRTGRDGPAIMLYDYQTTRAGRHVKKFLEGFKGYLHVDGYEGAYLM